MKTKYAFALIILAGLPLHAAPAPSPDAQWQSALVAREQRANLLLEELKALDARIEGRIDLIVSALRKIGDSKDSRTKVARMKVQTIDDLSKSISYYQTKRASLQEELCRPTLQLTEEQKRNGIAAFDARIEKRVAQILAVQKSLPQHKDYEKYKATGSNDWRGTTYEDNKDHEQNRPVTTYTDSERKKVAEGLRSSISRLEQQNRALKSSKAPAPEIARNEALLGERRTQLASSLTPGGTKTRDVGKSEAASLDKALQTSISELRKDFTTLFARYSAYLREQSDVNRARAAVAAVAKS